MEGAIIILWLASVVIVGLLALFAPQGWEDADGWHPGVEPDDTTIRERLAHDARGDC